MNEQEFQAITVKQIEFIKQLHSKFPEQVQSLIDIDFRTLTIEQASGLIKVLINLLKFCQRMKDKNNVVYKNSNRYLQNAVTFFENNASLTKNERN